VHWKPAIEWRAAYAQFTIFFPERFANYNPLTINPPWIARTQAI